MLRFMLTGCLCDGVFLFGTSSTLSKVQQIEIAAQSDCVSEIDVVANFGLIRSGMYDAVTDAIKACDDMSLATGRH